MKAVLPARAKPTAADAAAKAPASRTLQRKCACGQSASGGECTECNKKKLQRKPATSTISQPGTAPPIVNEVLQTSGQSLDVGTRGLMESHFGHDFSMVRVHTDSQAAESARVVDAEAYTVGRHVVFGSGRYEPRSTVGRRVLAHELTHVVQQRDAAGADDAPIELCNRSDYEGQAESAANGLNASPVGSLTPAAPALMRLSPADFRKQLGSTPDQKTAIDALYANAEFSALWDYMKDCPLTPKKDLGPLNLKVTPGLQSGAVERYGGYSPGSRTLEINPTKPEHKDNPAELVDTITHELIHAVSDLEAGCVTAGAKASPLAKAGAGTATAPSRADLAGKPKDIERLTKEQGPGASDPCGEFLDINAAAQHMIVSIIESNIQVAKVGRPTLVFVNEILRSNPKALADYTSCRDVACAKPVAADKDKAIATCSADILTKYYAPPAPPGPASQPKLGGFELRHASTLSASMAGSLTLDAFELDKSKLTAEHQRQILPHAETMVKLLRDFPDSFVTVVGHTDATGSDTHNKGLGQERADAVLEALVAAGVPREAMRAYSLGESALRIDTKGPEPRNRRVEIQFTARKQRYHLGPEPKTPGPGPTTSPPPTIDVNPCKLNPALCDPGEPKPDYFKPIPPAPKGSGPKSPLDVIGEKILDPVIDGVAGGLSKNLRDKIKEGARSAVKSGAAKGARAAAEAAGLTDPQGLDAIEKAAEAAIQEKGKSFP
jgi:outer membrane protein OmpA-like peptidoglycan-associated protein